MGAKAVRAWSEVCVRVSTKAVAELGVPDYDSIADAFLDYLKALREEGERPPKFIGDASKTVSLEDFVQMIRRGDAWAINYLRELAEAWSSITT